MNTWERRTILAIPSVHAAFREYCRRGPAFGMAVADYVLMPDHVHFLVAEGSLCCGLGQFVKGLRRAMGTELTGMGVGQPFWQPGFFDHLLRSDESYIDKAQYIRANPVRRGLAGRADDWPYGGRIFDPGPLFL